MTGDEKPDTVTTISDTGNERIPETARREQLVGAISNESFNAWYREKQFIENILEGKPYFNGASPPPDDAKHSPSKLLQCHRRVRYYAENAPQEGDPPKGLFWVGSKFEEEVVVPYFLDEVTTENTYVRNSMWIDTTLSEDPEVRVKGVTDPVIVDPEGDPILVTEIKTTSSLEYLDGPKTHHRAQLHAYMYALDEAYDRGISDGVLLYGGRDTLDITAFHIAFDDQFWWNRVVPWMQTQTQYRQDNELPPADPIFDWECDMCPFKNRCGQTDTPYENSGFTGLLPGVDEYRKQQLREYFDAYPKAMLTPTLAHEYPTLAEEQDVYCWECSECEATYEWDEVEVGSPVCPSCAEDGELRTLHVPGPEHQ